MNNEMESLITIEQLKESVQSVNAKSLPEIKFTREIENDVIYEKLLPLLNNKRLEEYKNFLDKNSFIAERIKKTQSIIPAYNSETITLVYFLSTVRARSLPANWPIELTILQNVYSDMGISPSWAVI